MNKKINSSPNHVAQLGRTSFDMSKEIKFTSSVGHLLPIYFDYLSPGEKIKIGTSLFTRTKPLATPAFVSIKEHVDYFFVPFRQLGALIENKLTDMSDVKSDWYYKVSQGERPTTSNLPSFLINDVLSELAEVDLSFLDSHGTYVRRFQPMFFDFCRLIDMLGATPVNFQRFILGSDLPFPIDASNSFSLLPILAYHKIFSDHYRIKEYTPNRVDLYNVDSLMFFDDVMSSSEFIRRGLFTLHYRPFEKDFFTNIFPSPLSPISFNSLGLQPTLLDVNSQAGFGSVIKISGRLDKSDSNSFTGTPITESVQLPSSMTNVSAIRAAYAYDKLLRITEFAPKTVDAQIAAHFGFKVPQGIDGQVYYLGSDTSRIDVGEVASTSDTLSVDGSQGAQLGALAGKGAGYTEGKAIHEFTAPSYGVLMAIYSAVPTSDYQSNVDKLLVYNTIDHFYRPEFDNLGLQALYTSQLAMSKPVNGSSSSPFLGFQYRWSELKQKYNSVHGDFVDTLKDWVSIRNTQSFPNQYEFPNSTDVNNFLYCSPSALDNITEVNYVPAYLNTINPTQFLTETKLFTRDPLMHWFTIHCYKTSTMSTYGLPTL